jgi:hypothetical protein
MSRAFMLFLAIVTATVLASNAKSAEAQILLAPEEAAKIVSIKDLKASPSSVSGVIVNNTPHTIRDVELLIQYHWLWANEFKPGPESPGRAVVVKLDKELKPGQSAPFNYTPDPPLPRRSDGQYDPEVVVAAFTVFSEGAASR